MWCRNALLIANNYSCELYQNIAEWTELKGKNRNRQKLKKLQKLKNYKKTQARGQLTIFASIKFEVRGGHQNPIPWFVSVGRNRLLISVIHAELLFRGYDPYFNNLIAFKTFLIPFRASGHLLNNEDPISCLWRPP